LAVIAACGAVSAGAIGNMIDAPPTARSSTSSTSTSAPTTGRLQRRRHGDLRRVVVLCLDACAAPRASTPRPERRKGRSSARSPPLPARNVATYTS
jgi:hypothetical protein